jgi:ubiquinone/menaquinone biosynthesis C-methylase UbiE
MDWHARYLSQARWTRDLREYLFDRTGFEAARRVLEVGCGTGAVLGQLADPPLLFGLDVDPEALRQCGVHAPRALRVRADAHHLPYLAASFDIVYCHFLLLWLADPLQALREMKRVTRPRGHILALAEPDHAARIDEPADLEPLGRWQAESLKRQGADPAFGRRLADAFSRAGIHIRETGKLQSRDGVLPSPDERALEWQVLESDLEGSVPADELARMRALDEQAWAQSTRRLEVPTYFAWGTA